MKHKRTLGILFLSFMIFILLTFTTCQRKDAEKDTDLGLTMSSKILKQEMDEYWNNMLEEYNSLKLKFGLKVEKLADISYGHAQSLAEKAQADQGQKGLNIRNTERVARP